MTASNDEWRMNVEPVIWRLSTLPPKPAERSAARREAPAAATEKDPGAAFYHLRCCFQKSVLRLLSAQPGQCLEMRPAQYAFKVF
jgi:hypothetical protein